MIDTEQRVTIGTPIDEVWDYVQHIGKWADLMPGLQDCTVLDTHNSRWTLKVGVGALVRTVNVNVCVDEWDGPAHVSFAFTLEGDPVQGGGTYTARAQNGHETDVTLNIQVLGTGPMAPMWEALGKPLLPQFAKTFAGQLKERIEDSTGRAPVSNVAPGRAAPSRIAAWLKLLWRVLTGSTSKA
jgi:carbon monoxide dehydrogenase subunit G